MSRIIKSAKHLLLHKDSTTEAPASGPTEEVPKRERRRRSKGGSDGETAPEVSRLDSDVCVPQLGHTTGYSHERLRELEDTGQVNGSPPFMSTVSQEPLQDGGGRGGAGVPVRQIDDSHPLP